MNVTFEGGRFYRQAQPIIQKRNESVQTMVWSFVALIDQGVRAVNSLHPRIVFGQWRQVWIVFPKIGKWRPHICDKSPRMTTMQVADRGSEHDNISGRKAAFKQQLAHNQTRQARAGITT